MRTIERSCSGKPDLLHHIRFSQMMTLITLRLVVLGLMPLLVLEYGQEIFHSLRMCTDAGSTV
jgi:hypothetical protein